MKRVPGMHLWILNHYAGPPATTPATRTYDLAQELARSGIQCTIFACSFNHYSFQEEQLQPHQLFRIELLERVRVIWIRGIPYTRNGFMRLLNMVVFALLALLIGIVLQPRPALIIGVTVHPFAPLCAWALSRIRRTRFWMDITDIWPQSLIDLGHLRNTSMAAILLGMLDLFSLKRADRVLSVLPNIGEYLRDRALSQKPHTWIPNGISKRRFPPPITVLNHTPAFRVMYAGGFAPAHALEHVLQAAAIVQHADPDVQFVLIGDGPEMPELKRMIAELALQNVELPGFIPKHRVYDYLQTADVCLVTSRKLPVYRYGVSFNKISDYLISGKPVIFATLAHNNPISDSGAGMTIPPEHPGALAKAILQMRRMPHEERRRMGVAGYQYALHELNYTYIADRLRAIIEEDCTDLSE